MSIVAIDQNHAAPAAVGETSLTGQFQINGIVTATLIGFTDDGRVPLVIYSGQHGAAAIPARATVDLHGSHIGCQVVVMFERGDPDRPIVIGRVRGDEQRPRQQNQIVVDVEADGDRTIVSAKEQLVLKCGKASITLTRSGKVLVSGTYVLSHSTGANRVKGGSVQLN